MKEPVVWSDFETAHKQDQKMGSRIDRFLFYFYFFRLASFPAHFSDHTLDPIETQLG
jgi:hypothetical protein